MFFFFKDMETGEVWSLHAKSTYLKTLFESFGIIDSVDQKPSFAKGLLSVIECDNIVNDINLLSKREVVLQTTLPSQAGHATLLPVYVLEVEVCCTQGTLRVKEKVFIKMNAFTHIFFTF